MKIKKRAVRETAFLFDLNLQRSERASSGVSSVTAISVKGDFLSKISSMEYHNEDEPWDWQGGDYNIQKDSNTDMSDCLWNEGTQNDEDLSYMFPETTTPVRACGDLGYHVTHCGSGSKEPEERTETYSQAKRRRTLQFNNMNCSEDMSSMFLKSNEREGSVDEILTEVSQWISGCSDASASASSHDAVVQSSDGWLAECLKDTEMTFSPDDANFSGASDVQIDISGFWPPGHEANHVQRPANQTPTNIVIRGRKSYTRPPTKLASAIAYPFAFIKPCGVRGDVTLKDINQRILTPPPSKSKQSNEELDAAFPTSAFSGKPVVGKTKIRTEGGKGSITIMRTRG